MKTRIFLLLTAILITGISYGQLNKTEYELIKDQFKLEKKAVVAEALHLTPQQETAFWPLYNKYEDERTATSKKSWELLENYAANFETLTDTAAQSLIASSLKVNKDLITLREKYLKLIAKQVSPGVAAKFIQLEDYIATNLRQELLSHVPMFGDLKTKQ